MFLSGVYRIIQPLETFGPKIYITASRVEDLEVNLVGICVCGGRQRVDVAKAPDAQNLVLSLRGWRQQDMSLR